MDHLPELQLPQRQILVKFYANSAATFKPNDFFTLPETHGHSSILENGLKPGTSPESRRAFLQSWLFFSLLSQVLGVDIEAGDFRCHEPKIKSRLTTKKLPQYLKAWNEREINIAPDDNEAQIRRHISASLALNEARTFVLEHCSDTNILPARGPLAPRRRRASSITAFVPSSDEDDILSLSFAILGEALERDRPKIDLDNSPLRYWNLQSEQPRSWGTSVYLSKRLVEAGWCSRDIHRLQMTAPDVSTVYYTLSFKPLRSKTAHTDCTKTYCEGISSNGHAKTPHTDDDCNCALLSLDITRLERILQKGGIPLLTYGDSGDLDVWEYTPGHDAIKGRDGPKALFGAVSHSWSDALGSTEDGGLPECQIKQLQQDFDKIFSHEDTPIPFWIDSLCIPASYESKKLAIKGMRNVYECADAVLVRDSNLMETSSRIAFLEATVRINTGVWTQRLWTLQEGVLSKNLYFKFKDGFLQTSDLHERYRDAKDNPESDFHYVARAGWQFSPAIISLREQKPDASLTKEHRKQRLVERQRNRVAHMWQAIQWRSTSRASDETVCLATLIEMDPEPLLNIDPSDEGAVTKRMKKFLMMLDENVGIPPGIIFLPGPHLETPGYSWAPTSWMTEQTGEAAIPFFPHQQRVSYLTKKGLLVEYPGVVLHFSKKSVNRVFWVPVSPSLHKWYRVEAETDEETWQKIWKHAEDKSPSIILSKFEPQEVPQIAVFVAQDHEREEYRKVPGRVDWEKQTTKFVHIMCRVWVCLETSHEDLVTMKRDFRKDIDYSLWGDRLEIDQKWCVDGDNRESE